LGNSTIKHLEISLQERATEEVLPVLATLSALEELDLSHSKIRFAFEKVAKASRLRKVSASHTPLVNLAGIEKLEHLTELNLWNAKFVKKDLAVLKKLSNLKVLNLNYCGLNDNDVAELASHGCLEKISLVGNPISVRGLESLARSQTIKELDVSDNPEIDEADVEGLHRRFPHVQIMAIGLGRDAKAR
jgi:Leucine-rich repeat (LRR) protein